MEKFRRKKKQKVIRRKWLAERERKVVRYREKKQMFRLVSLDMMRHITIGDTHKPSSSSLSSPPLHLKENKMRKLKNLYYSTSPGESLSPCVWRRRAPYTFLP